MQSISVLNQKFNRISHVVLYGAAFTAMIVTGFGTANAQTAPSLGTASSFAVLGGSTVTNTGPSVISGDLGVSPGTAVTGFPPGIVAGGTIHAADAVAAQAEADTATAYQSVASEACTATYSVPTDLSGQTLIPGVYCFASSVGLAGTLTLNAQGNANAVFLFKIGSTLITGSNSVVNLINGAQQCNVFYQVGSSATLGTGTQLVGTILALTSISLDTNAKISGRALARNGAVTMDSNTVSLPTCGGGVAEAPPTLTKSFSPASVTAGSDATLTITLGNTNGTAASLTAPLIDAFPAGLTVAGAGTNTCGGTLTGNTGSTSVTLTGGVIPLNGTCRLTVPVTGTTVGSFINSLAAGSLSTTAGSNATPAIATLTITTAGGGTGGSGGGTGTGGTGTGGTGSGGSGTGTGGSGTGGTGTSGGGTGTSGGGSGPGGGTDAGSSPTVGKSFSPSTIALNGVSMVTITLNNSETTAAKLTAPLTDMLPQGLMVAGAATTTCGGAVTAVKGGASVTLMSGSIPAEGSCSVTVAVNAKCSQCSGNYYNSIAAGALQTTNGKNTQAAMATLTVSPAPPAGGAPYLIKSFWPDTIMPGASSTLYIDLKNPSGTASTLTAPLVDHMPTGMTVVGNPTDPCGGTLTAVKGSNVITLTGSTIPENGTCRITVLVSATTNGKADVAGSYVNTLGIGVLKTTTGNNHSPASATLLVSESADSGPTLSKSFSPALIREGQDTTLTIYLVNSATTVAKLTAPFSDHMPAGMMVAGVSSNTCGGAMSAAPGSSTVTMTGGSIPAKGSCRLTVLVTAHCGVYWNEIAVGALKTSNGSNKETYGATLTAVLN